MTTQPSRRHLRATLFASVIGCVMSISASAQPSQRILDQAVIEPQVGGTLQLDVVFRDHNGDETTLRAMLGDGPAVLCMVYFECPMLCKLAADGLVRSLTEVDADVGEDVQVILVSFDLRDTPQQATATRDQLIRRYARPGTDAGWHCLTGDDGAINQLTSSLGFRYVWDDQTKQYAHATGLFLISPEGVITDCLNGVEFPPDTLTAAIDTAQRGVLNETTFAGEEPVSFLRCYLYDPTTGKFGSAVQWTVRVLGIATVVALACGVAMLIRRQRLAPAGRG